MLDKGNPRRKGVKKLMTKKDQKTKEPDKTGHIKPTKADLKAGKAAPRGRNRGRGR